MDGCNCSMVISAELKALLDSDKSDAKERTLTSIETLLTSRDMEMRKRGYALLEEGINDALLCSCFNYRSLVGGFTHPLLTVVKHAFETWARASEHH